MHLVGFYYKNISRCTVLWMSKGRTCKCDTFYPWYVIKWISFPNSSIGHCLHTPLFTLIVIKHLWTKVNQQGFLGHKKFREVITMRNVAPSFHLTITVYQQNPSAYCCTCAKMAWLKNSFMVDTELFAFTNIHKPLFPLPNYCKMCQIWENSPMCLGSTFRNNDTSWE